MKTQHPRSWDDFWANIAKWVALLCGLLLAFSLLSIVVDTAFVAVALTTNTPQLQVADVTTPLLQTRSAARARLHDTEPWSGWRWRANGQPVPQWLSRQLDEKADEAAFFQALAAASKQEDQKEIE